MANNTKSLTKQTPAEIDTVLAELWKSEQRLRANIDQMKRSAKMSSRLPYRVAQDEALVKEYEAKLAEVRSQAKPLESEFTRRGGWLRYFLVTNGNGHVHRGMDCATCFPTTEYAWLPTLSGCDETAMVAEWGEKACTVCFPAAPTMKGFGDGTSAHAKRTKAEVEARQAEKAAKAADKASKAITAPDGSPLRVGYSTLNTKISAQRALSEAVQSYGWYGPTHPSDFASQIKTLVEALEAADIDTAPIIERANKKVAKDSGQYQWEGK